ncbi:MAG: helix-turn-helix domain-containing protein [Methylococcaceae bacterium]|jgi:DNA-binding winged helix-turn-helix (wHTH) protein
MKITNNIVVFDNDECLLALLKGYGYSNNLSITSLDLSLSNINALDDLQPMFVILPLTWLEIKHKGFEINTLRQSSLYNHLKICGLNKDHAQLIPLDVYAWLDFIINDTMDIAAIDQYIKTRFFNQQNINRRNISERRFVNDRRSSHLDNKHKASLLTHTYPLPQKQKNNDFIVDEQNKCVFVYSYKVKLTPKEYGLIELLNTDVERIFKAEQIINHLWPENNRATKLDLYQYIHLLRKKIEPDPNNPQWLINVKGFGYKLNLNATEIPKQQPTFKTGADIMLAKTQSSFT